MTDEYNHKKEIFVSVIIPVYNAESYLPQCLDSICHQTLHEIEIICIDDGSIDHSLEILKDYAKNDKRIIILQQQNAGAGAARNKGLKIAKGKYLAFLDADDFFDLNFLKAMYQNAVNKNADIVICAVNEYDHMTGNSSNLLNALNSNYIPNQEIFSYKDLPQYIFNTFQNWTWNKLFCTKLIQDNTIMFQEIMRTNDLLFTCVALIQAERIAIVRDRLVYYRVNHGGNCQSNNEKAPMDFYYAFLALKEYLQVNGYYENVRKSYQNWAAEACIYNIFSLRYGRDELTDFLEREGFEKLDIDRMKCSDYHSKLHYFKMILLKKRCWNVIDTLKKLNRFFNNILKRE